MVLLTNGSQEDAIERCTGAGAYEAVSFRVNEDVLEKHEFTCGANLLSLTSSFG